MKRIVSKRASEGVRLSPRKVFRPLTLSSDPETNMAAAAAAAANRRSRVVQLYKQIIYMGREYPDDPGKFNRKVHDVFMQNSAVTDPQQVEAMIGKAEYILKELEALYMLKKYRTLKRRYSQDPVEKPNR